MVKRQNHYEVLGVQTDVTQSDIKKAFRQLVKKCHPDLEYSRQSDSERLRAKELMQQINQAYETLVDKKKRKAYDHTIGLGSALRRVKQENAFSTKDEERRREEFLGKVFNPARRSIVKILNQYKKRLSLLEQDIYDDELLEQFSKYVDMIEKTLREASNSFTINESPETLVGSVRWMRHSIAQASDGLDELHHFCNNYDYDHLSMASNLFKIALEHAARAQQLTKL